MSDISDLITLNVGGTIKKISEKIIKKSPIFDKLLSEEDYRNKEIFIDRDPLLFDDVTLYFAWDIIPTEPASIYELDHYGIYIEENDNGPVNKENENKLTNIEKLSTQLFDQITDVNIKPFYISACGIIYVTTIERLKAIGFFSGLFSGYFKDINSGDSVDNPYSVDIPSKYFTNILLHLRDQRNDLLSQSKSILKVLGYKYEKSQKYKGNSNGFIVEDDNNSSGALMDLVCYGPENIYLNDNPQQTLWRSTYKRMTNSSLHKFTITPEYVNPTKFVASLKGKCDLLRNISLYVDFLIDDEIVNEYVLAKDNNILYKLIDRVQFINNETIIESLSGYQMHMISLMNNNPVQQTFNDKMRNFINIPFSFLKASGNVLPLISLSSPILEICINNNILYDKIVVRPKLYCSGVFLDTDERRDFAQKPQEYLHSYYHTHIEFDSFDRGGVSKIQCKLDFNHPTKAIFFTLHDNNGDLVEDLISFKLMFNGQHRSSGGRTECGMLNRLESNINIGCPVFVIPFAIDPLDDDQPTTHVNLSRIGSVILYLSVGNEVKTARVWGNYWNVLRIMNGITSMAYN